MPPAHARHKSGHSAAAKDAGAGQARPRYGTVQRRLLAISTGLGVAVLAGAAFVLSYDDLRALALEGHAARRWAPAYPVMVDALIVVTILALVVARHSRWWTRWPRWILLLLLIAGPAAASVQRSVKGYAPLPDQPLKIGVAVAPYVLLLIAAWLWLTMFRQMHRAQAAGSAVAAPAPAPATAVEPAPAHEPAHEPGRDLRPEPVPAPRPEPLALPREHDDLVPGMSPARRHEPVPGPLPEPVRQPSAPEPWLDAADTEPVLQGQEGWHETGVTPIGPAGEARAHAAPAPVREEAATAIPAERTDETVPAIATGHADEAHYAGNTGNSGNTEDSAIAEDAVDRDERAERPQEMPPEPAAAGAEHDHPAEGVSDRPEPDAGTDMSPADTGGDADTGGRPGVKPDPGPSPEAVSEPAAIVAPEPEPEPVREPPAPAEPVVRAPYSLPTDVRLVSRPQPQQPSLAATTQPDMFLPDLLSGQEGASDGSAGTTGASDAGDVSDAGDDADDSDAIAGLADDRAEDPDAGDDSGDDVAVGRKAMAGTGAGAGAGADGDSTDDTADDSGDDADQWSALGAGDVHLIADDLDASAGDPFFDEASEEDLDWTPPSSRFRSSPTPPGDPR